MSRKEKLIGRFLEQPKDFTWDELVRLLAYFGFKETKSGKTRGSRRAFINKAGLKLNLHKPHPQNIVKRYAMELVCNFLKENGYI